jgi:hypothetical protein
MFLAQADGALSVNSHARHLRPREQMDDPKFDQKGSYIELWNGKDKFQLNERGGTAGLGGKK